MADTRLQKVGITVKEPWAVDISYEVLDMTLHAVEDGGDGCSYVALKDNIGVTPGTDPTTWVKSTQAGQSIYDLAVKYKHFEGTEEEFEAEYQAVLQAARDAAAGASAVEAQVEAAETARVAAEASRADAESARQSAEASRASAETARGTAEAARQSAESGRASAETARVTAEQGRASAESERASAEAARAAAEADRVSDFSALRTDMQTAIGQADAATAAAVATNNQIQTAETGRVSAEQGRVSAENARASAESARATAESGRATAETARATAEGQRATAEGQRVTAENARVSAESGRASAESARVTAEAARVSAETARESQASSDHTRAESDHAIVQGYDTRLTTVEGEVSQLGQTLTAINPKDFVIGSIYAGALDTSISDAISTNSFYDVRGVESVVVYSGGRGNRVNFYDANKNYLSFTGSYTNDTSFVVPVGAAFCKLSFAESGVVWDLSNINVGEFRSNVLVNDVVAFLGNVDSVSAKMPVINIDIKYFAVGSLYLNYLDTSVKQAISTRDRFYFVRPLSKVYFRANLNGDPYQTRVSFYNSAHEFLSQEGYQDTDSFNVPNNAFYCKFSFLFERDTAINLNELVQGNFATNAIEEDYQGEYNNGSRLLLPISKGHINFDNTAKKIVINGQIGILYNHSMQYVESGVEIQYPNDLTPGSGTYFFFVYDGAQFSILMANTDHTNITALEKVAIVACIWIDSTQTIRRDNISFCVVPFKIDNDRVYDLDKLKEFSTHLISNNPVDTFLFFTDPHLENNAFIDFAKSDVMKNIENYYKRASLAKCICGGDWMNQFSDDSLGAAAVGNAYGFCYSTFHDFLPVQGNHDFNTYTDKPPLSNQTTVNIMMQKYGKNYYFEDNVVSRYYIFDSGYDTYTTVATPYQYEQVDWVANLLLNGTKLHNVFFIHQALIGSPDVYSGFVNHLTALANAFNNKQSITINGVTYDFANSIGRVHCVIAGHRHFDFNALLNNIPIVLTIDAQRGFDMCAIDYDAGKLYMTRIGEGQSREIDLA